MSEYSADPYPGQGRNVARYDRHYESRLLPLAAAGRASRWMGEPPPTTGHRLLGGGEPCSQGAAEGATRPVDRRSAPTPGGQGPATWSPGPEAGSDHRNARHDAAVARSAGRPEVDVRAAAARASRNHEGDRAAHCADGDRESKLGLQPYPRRVE